MTMEAMYLCGAHIGERWRVTDLTGEVVEDIIDSICHTRRPFGGSPGAPCVVVKFKHALEVWATPDSEVVMVAPTVEPF